MPSKSACCGWTWTPTRTGTGAPRHRGRTAWTVAGPPGAVACVTRRSRGRPTVSSMDSPSRHPRKVVVEDPDDLGYRLVADPLLDVMPAEDWLALERRVLADRDV